MRLSLGSRLILTIVPVVALCLGATGLLALTGAEAVVDRFAATYGRDLAEGERSRILTFFERNARTADTLAQVAAAMVANGRTDRAVVADMVRRTALASEAALGVWFLAEPDVIGRDADFRDASIAEADPLTGRFFTYFAKRQGFEGFELSPPDTDVQPFYAGPRDRRAAVLVPPYHYPIFGEPVLMTSYAVPAFVGDRFVGVAGVDFELKALALRFAELRPLGGTVRVVNDDGTWIYSPDFSVIGTNRLSGTDPLSRLTAEELVNIRNGTPFQRDIAVGRDTFRRIAVPLLYLSGEERSRTLLVDLPLTELRRPFAAIRTTILVAGGLSLLLVAGVVLLGIRAAVGQPLEKVRLAVQRLDAGDTRTDMPLLDRQDAIGDVARALEAFRVSLAERADLQRSLAERGAQMRRLAAAMDEAQDAVLTCNHAFQVTYANRAALALLGAADGAQVMGRRWQALLAPPTLAALGAVEPGLPDGLARDGAWAAEIAPWKTLAGLRAEAVEARATRLSDGSVLMVLRDMTEAKRQAREQAEMEARLVQQQRLEAVGRLAGGIAHDFNNLLGAMMGYLEFLVADLPPGSPQRTYAERAAKVGDRSKEMIRHILSFSRPGVAGIAPVAPAAVLAEAAALLKPTMPSSLRLEVAADPGLPPALANATQLVQVLMNLAINARDAMAEDKGVIRLTAGRFEQCGEAGAATGWPSYRALVAEPGVPLVCFEVRDSGQGIAPDKLATVFEPFFTTKDLKGTGLGLATVHAIVKAHGGGLALASMEGEGTLFQVCLPAGGTATAAVADTAQGCPAGLGGLRVLVVDDETEMGDMLLEGLGRLGLEVAVCENAEEAAEVFEEDAHAFDAVITDQTMPGATGMALIARLKAIRPDLPCILYTGYSERLDEAGALAGGADAFHTKPVKVRELAATLARLAGERVG